MPEDTSGSALPNAATVYPSRSALLHFLPISGIVGARDVGYLYDRLQLLPASECASVIPALAMHHDERVSQA